jgi:ABC-type multidrug transport system ATPase subunit
MKITLRNTGKRYNREWIFRHLNFEFNAGESYAITGPNGSGKSTLLQVIAGAVIHNEGEILFWPDGASSPVQDLDRFNHLAIAAPYLDLIEEMTGAEFLKFHHVFKRLTEPVNGILEKVGLGHAMQKQIRYYSSGMKQRLKLAQAFFSDTPVLLLDEPTSNLDASGIQLYNELISGNEKKKLIIVCSNDEHEFSFCAHKLSVSDFKKD